MRIFSLLVGSFLFSNMAFSQSAILLPPMKGNNFLDIVATKNITGSCGTSIVRALGVVDVVDNFYSIDDDAGKIIVRAGVAKEMVLSSNNGILSDHNGMACISTKFGNRLLVWSNCSGSACGEKFSFFIIDPERLVFLAPKDPRKNRCDEKCASQILGNKFPQKINAQ